MPNLCVGLVGMLECFCGGDRDFPVVGDVPLVIGGLC